MAKAPYRPPEAKRFTRDDALTALVLLDELKAAAKAAAPASPHKSTLDSPHTSREMLGALDAAAALASCARVVHTVAERDCNGWHSEAEETANRRREALAIARATVILAPYGVSFKTGGDPRGACFYLLTPQTERHNTWGGKESGWAVV